MCYNQQQVHVVIQNVERAPYSVIENKYTYARKLKPSVTLYLFLKSEKVQPHKKTQYQVKSKMGISEKLKRKQFITDVIKSQLPMKTLRMCNQMYRENDQNIF